MDINQTTNQDADKAFSFFLDEEIDEVGTDTTLVGEGDEPGVVDSVEDDVEGAITSKTSTEDDSAKQTPTEKVPDQDADRAKFWQSKYNKLFDEHRTETDKYKQMDVELEMAQILRQNPNLLDDLQEHLKEKTSKKSVTKPQVEEPSLQRPAKPQKPSNYNAYEASNDEQSESFKYRDALGEYQEKMVEYHDAKESIREKELATQQEMFEREAASRKHEAQSRDALIKSGLKPEKLDEFYKVMTGASSVEPKNLILYYNLLTGQGSGEDSASVAKANFDKQRNRLNNSPLPAGGTSGETTATPSPDDLFNEALLSFKRK